MLRMIHLMHFVDSDMMQMLLCLLNRLYAPQRLTLVLSCGVETDKYTTCWWQTFSATAVINRQCIFLDKTLSRSVGVLFPHSMHNWSKKSNQGCTIRLLPHVSNRSVFVLTLCLSHIHVYNVCHSKKLTAVAFCIDMDCFLHMIKTRTWFQPRFRAVFL